MHVSHCCCGSSCCFRARQLSRRCFNVARDRLVLAPLKQCGHMWPRPPQNVPVLSCMLAAWKCYKKQKLKAQNRHLSPFCHVKKTSGIVFVTEGTLPGRTRHRVWLDWTDLGRRTTLMSPNTRFPFHRKVEPLNVYNETKNKLGFKH